MVELNDQLDEKTITPEKTSKAREAILDCVSPYLEPLYEIFIEDFVKKYNIVLPASFFFFIGLFFFSVISLYFNLSYQGAIFFLLVALLILIAKNRKQLGYILNKKILFDKGKFVDDFIREINTKELDEVKKFILNNYRELDSNDLILLMQSKFYDNASFHMTILKKQVIENELLEFMINNDLDQKIGEDIFCIYLKYCYNPISLRSYEKLAARNVNNPKIIQTLNACFPQYLKNHSIFKWFANVRIQIKESIRYGKIRGIICFFWAIMGVLALTTHPISVPTFPKNITSDAGSQAILNVISMINIGMSYLLTVAIFSFITLYSIMWLMRRYRSTLCYFAPKSIT